MQYFSIYDLIIGKGKDRSLTPADIYALFRKQKVTKEQLISLSNTSYLPEEEYFKRAILDFLGMSELEVSLIQGSVPQKYKDSYFSNIKKIAALLEEKVTDPTQVVTPFYQDHNGTLFKGDCLEVLKTFPSNSVDMVFADPPFNLGKEYDPGVSDDLSMSKYLNWTYDWLDECVRILKPGGLINVYNIPKWNVYIASHLGEQLTFWDWIAVDMKYSLPVPNRLYPAHYSLVSYVKGTKPNTFINQRIPMQVCRHCGGEIKDYGGYKSKMNPSGVNVSDVWTDIYPVRHKNSKNRKFNELPVKLLDRVISMTTNKGDIVLDPFGGSGTTYAVAALLNRRWIGCELGDCEIIRQRLINPEKDRKLLDKVYEEKNCLFTEETLKLRKENGFWTRETFENKQVSDGDQLSLSF